MNLSKTWRRSVTDLNRWIIKDFLSIGIYSIVLRKFEVADTWKLGTPWERRAAPALRAWPMGDEGHAF